MLDRRLGHPRPLSDWFLLALVTGYFALVVVGAAMVIIYYEGRDIRASEREIERAIQVACQRPK